MSLCLLFMREVFPKVDARFAQQNRTFRRMSDVRHRPERFKVGLGILRRSVVPGAENGFQRGRRKIFRIYGEGNAKFLAGVMKQAGVTSRLMVDYRSPL